MLVYKNLSFTKKTFYGVTFNPGETKEVNGFINDPKFIRVDAMPKEPPKNVMKTASASKQTQPKPNLEKGGEKTDGKDSDQ